MGVFTFQHGGSRATQCNLVSSGFVRYALYVPDVLFSSCSPCLTMSSPLRALSSDESAIFSGEIASFSIGPVVASLPCA